VQVASYTGRWGALFGCGSLGPRSRWRRNSHLARSSEISARYHRRQAGDQL